MSEYTVEPTSVTTVPFVPPVRVSWYFVTAVSSVAGFQLTTTEVLVALAVTPVVLAYQAWSYWVFRKRVAPHQLPEPHDAVPAIRRPVAADHG